MMVDGLMSYSLMRVLFPSQKLPLLGMMLVKGRYLFSLYQCLWVSIGFFVFGLGVMMWQTKVDIGEKGGLLNVWYFYSALEYAYEHPYCVFFLPLVAII